MRLAHFPPNALNCLRDQAAKNPGECGVDMRLLDLNNLVCGVDQALRAWSTPHTKLFARPRRASIRREKAKPLSIRHALVGMMQYFSLVKKRGVVREKK